jgi:hypothetical protein
MKDDTGRVIVDEDAWEWLEAERQMWFQERTKLYHQVEHWMMIAGALGVIELMRFLFWLDGN